MEEKTFNEWIENPGENHLYVYTDPNEAFKVPRGYMQTVLWPDHLGDDIDAELLPPPFAVWRDKALIYEAPVMSVADDIKLSTRMPDTTLELAKIVGTVANMIRAREILNACIRVANETLNAVGHDDAFDEAGDLRDFIQASDAQAFLYQLGVTVTPKQAKTIREDIIKRVKGILEYLLYKEDLDEEDIVGFLAELDEDTWL